jgi:hypothetical protein
VSARAQPDAPYLIAPETGRIGISKIERRARSQEEKTMRIGTTDQLASAHMSYRLRECARRGVFALCLGAFFCPPALAAPDEIQVYLDDIREPGEAVLELHLNS